MRQTFRIVRPATLAPFLITSLLLLARHSPAQCTPDAVLNFAPGVNAGFGSGYFPGNVLGVPQGSDNPQTPNFNEQHVLSLGTGGTITFEFNTNIITNEPGPDFTVFENPVQPISNPLQTFADTAIVSVSSDGDTWYTFPFDMISSAPQQLVLKSNYIGFAGVQPVLTSSTNGVSPFDPSVSGGDQFDLDTVGLSSARFLRVTDSGDYRHAPTFDTQGDTVYDYGYLLDPNPTVPGAGISAGFDLDAIVAIHSQPWTSSVADWSTYE